MATTNKMIYQAFICRDVLQGADEVGTESVFFFESVDFVIHSEQYANTCMAVLIRRVTCKSLFSFWGQRKVLSCEIYRRGLRPCFLHDGELESREKKLNRNYE